MNIYVDKSQENKKQISPDMTASGGGSDECTLCFDDNRPEAVTQRKLEEKANNHSVLNFPMTGEKNNTETFYSSKSGKENIGVDENLEDTANQKWKRTAGSIKKQQSIPKEHGVFQLVKKVKPRKRFKNVKSGLGKNKLNPSLANGNKFLNNSKLFKNRKWLNHFEHIKGNDFDEKIDYQSTDESEGKMVEERIPEEGADFFQQKERMSQEELQLALNVIKQEIVNDINKHNLNDTRKISESFEFWKEKYNLKSIDFINLMTSSAAIKGTFNPDFYVYLNNLGRKVMMRTYDNRRYNYHSSVVHIPQTLDINGTTKTFGKLMKASPILNDMPVGEESNIDTAESLSVILPRASRGNDPKKKYIKGHLLNAKMGGTAEENNLFPITGHANNKHSQFVENYVLRRYVNGYVQEYIVEIHNVDMENLPFDNGNGGRNQMVIGFWNNLIKDHVNHPILNRLVQGNVQMTNQLNTMRMFNPNVQGGGVTQQQFDAAKRNLRAGLENAIGQNINANPNPNMNVNVQALNCFIRCEVSQYTAANQLEAKKVISIESRFNDQNNNPVKGVFNPTNPLVNFNQYNQNQENINNANYNGRRNDIQASNFVGLLNDGSINPGQNQAQLNTSPINLEPTQAYITGNVDHQNPNGNLGKVHFNMPIKCRAEVAPNINADCVGYIAKTVELTNANINVNQTSGNCTVTLNNLIGDIYGNYLQIINNQNVNRRIKGTLSIQQVIFDVAMANLANIDHRLNINDVQATMLRDEIEYMAELPKRGNPSKITVWGDIFDRGRYKKAVSIIGVGDRSGANSNTTGLKKKYPNNDRDTRFQEYR